MASTVIALATVILLCPVSTQARPRGVDARSKLNESAHRRWQVSAWSEGNETSLKTALTAKAINEVSVDWWASNADGSLSTGSGCAAFPTLTKSHHVRLLVTVSNWNNKIGGFDQSIPQQILSSSERTQAQISSLVSQCVACGYAGIDLDWESLVPSDRDLFSGFVSQLATALHARDKVLSIDVAAKTDDLGTWPTAESEDYAALGQAVDEFKIMTYDYSGSWSGPGPIAPTSWVDHVIRYAESKVPAGKIWVGVPFYGYDWNGTKSRSATTDVDCTVARRLIQKYRPRIRRLPDKEATFTYRKAGRTHVVVYQDRLSLAAKLAVLRKRHPEIAGICIWVMGGEDKRFWPLIASALGHSA